MASVIWTPQSVTDLENILYYVAVEQRRPEAAEQFASEFERVANQLGEHPNLGLTHPAAPAGWKYHRVRRWLLFFQFRSDGIEVMRVVDPARDLPALFGN